MARNPVQFQKGLSLIEFNRRYGKDEQCHAALIAMRWPDGFECPHCKGRKHSYSPARRIFQCSACRVQTSARAGTVFHKSHTPLVKWFLAIYLVTSAKNDIAALELARPAGRQVGHRLAHQAEADGGHAPAQRRLQAEGRGADR